MADLERLRPIEPAPLTPLRERQRRKSERDFDMQRELGGERGEEHDPQAPEGGSEALDAPVAKRGEDEAGARVDVTA